MSICRWPGGSYYSATPDPSVCHCCPQGPRGSGAALGSSLLPPKGSYLGLSVPFSPSSERAPHSSPDNQMSSCDHRGLLSGEWASWKVTRQGSALLRKLVGVSGSVDWVGRQMAPQWTKVAGLFPGNLPHCPRVTVVLGLSPVLTTSIQRTQCLCVA